MTSGALNFGTGAVDQAYALWADTYDSVPNPLLALEERYLGPILPPVQGKTVLDLGCGTGRLLAHPSLSRSAWYMGVDLSSAMLARAARKLPASGQLVQADCRRLPLRSDAADLVVCSFLLGYVDLGDLAAEIARVSKDAGDLYLSEFHPEVSALGWKRSFRRGDQVIELPTNSFTLSEVEQAFRLYGFKLAGRIEPGFGEAEREIFLAANKSDAFEASIGIPAIFICHLKRASRAA